MVKKQCELMHGMSVIVSKQFNQQILMMVVSALGLVLFASIGRGQGAAVTELAGHAAVGSRQVADDLPPIPRGMVVKFMGKETKMLAGDSLRDWSQVDFAGGRGSFVKSSVLTIEAGEMLSGVYWDGARLPKHNYELSLEARRTGGIDFFCGATVPVNDSHCCLIVGGWAGATVGLSNIDDQDASSNATTMLMAFEDHRWYKIRLRVLPDRIIAWIDDQCVVYQNITGKKISLRGDTELLTPMGLCTFATTAEMRHIVLRRIVPRVRSSKEKSNNKNASTQPKSVPQ